ncbi:hypothetical protein [Siphonobacter curvatus]|uniref:Uncharacterized protein n=1 Tax=Siphonobacter curvatus TaxID=2094562 RepID=A0A2S7IRB3_9BACT|nr:hypothetical protein [Siphonobacter curvatus]PQA60222.1 hypothetical protein C5O19_11570 [Siphonobacter curvatus]
MPAQLTIDSITDFCLQKLDFSNPKLDPEYYYAHLPLCVVDSVFSMGVKYESVRNVVRRMEPLVGHTLFRDYGSLPTDPAQQISVAVFLEKIEHESPEKLALEIYQNKQRTSTQNGILKAEAVSRFLRVLNDFDVQYFQDVPRLITNADFEQQIKRIPGQASGICLSYFFMLAGNDQLIKPDRMVLAFLEAITAKTVILQEAQLILEEVSSQLVLKGYEMNPRLLDNLIWNYQRKLPKKASGVRMRLEV